jgi:hypothetical protein
VGNGLLERKLSNKQITDYRARNLAAWVTQKWHVSDQALSKLNSLHPQYSSIPEFLILSLNLQITTGPPVDIKMLLIIYKVISIRKGIDYASNSFIFHNWFDPLSKKY